jgi:hypothetical protein
MIIAEISAYDPPVQICVWLGCSMFILVGLYYLTQVIAFFKGAKPAPPNEQLDERVTRIENELVLIRSELKKDRDDNEQHASTRSSHIYDKIDETRKEIDASVAGMAREGEISRKHLHDRINPLVENTAEIKGQMAAFQASFDNFTKIIVEIARKGST